MLDKDISTIPAVTPDGKVTGTLDGELASWETAPWSRGRYKGIKNITSTAYTLVADDEGQWIIHVNASASVINIPTDGVLTWPIGGKVKLQRDGAGQITMTAASGVALKAAGRPKFRVAESVAELVKIAANTWAFSGDTLA